MTSYELQARISSSSDGDPDGSRRFQQPHNSDTSDELGVRDDTTPAVASAELTRQLSRQGTRASRSERPYHVFNTAMKMFIVFNVSAVATLSGLSSNIYFPAQQDISVVGSLNHHHS